MEKSGLEIILRDEMGKAILSRSELSIFISLKQIRIAP